MGAISFTLDPRLLRELRRLLPLSVFVETGTFQGDTLELTRQEFAECYSVELSAKHYQAARQRFAGAANIRLFQGDSPAMLREHQAIFARQPTLFWLDAHWCAAENTAGGGSQCPLLAELAAIGPLHPQSVVLIDDARYFLGPPPVPHEISGWPDWESVLQALRRLSDCHALICCNDTIHFVPATVQGALRDFLHRHGVDLVTLADKARDYDALLAQAKGKEAEIATLKTEAEIRASQLITKDSQIQDLKLVCVERDALIHQLAFTGKHKFAHAKIFARHAALGIWAKFNRFCHSRTKVWLENQVPFRLGALNQYPPRPLTLEKFPRPQPPRTWPRLCLITPSYQQAGFLERTMHSVLDQNYPNLAYGVQDGGSTDGSVELIVKTVPRLAHAESAPDQGQSDAIRKGFAKLFPERQDIMAWLNSDDMLMPGALAYVGAYFARHPEVDVIYGHRVIIDENDQETGRWFLPSHGENTLPWFDLVPQETLFWRASCYDKVKGVDASFQFALDWDLLLRFEAAGCNIKRLPYFLGCFRQHARQKTSSRIHDVGEEEMQRLRLRTHGRRVQQWEILEQLSVEERRSALTAWLWTRGIRW